MYTEIARNKRRTIFLMIFFVIFIGGIGWALAYFFEDMAILYWVLGVVLGYTLLQYFLSGKIAVAMSGAKEIQKKDHPKLYNIIENISIQEGLPMPKVYVIKDPSPNAFAAGRDPKHAVVGVTTGLLDIMDDKEIQAVMAHEMAHIKNYDIRLATIVFGLVSAISLLANIGLRMGLIGGRRGGGGGGGGGAAGMIILVVGAILAPLIATIVQLAVSRNREYLADSSAALITRRPEAMISALRKLGNAPKVEETRDAALSSLFIFDHAKGLFSTHPPLKKRIERLEQAKFKF